MIGNGDSDHRTQNLSLAGYHWFITENFKTGPMLCYHKIKPKCRPTGIIYILETEISIVHPLKSVVKLQTELVRGTEIYCHIWKLSTLAQEYSADDQ